MLVDLDKVLMEVKLKVRSISNPGMIMDNLKGLDLGDSVKLYIHPRRPETSSILKVEVCRLEGKKFVIKYNLFDDCGEWEFRYSDHS